MTPPDNSPLSTEEIDLAQSVGLQLSYRSIWGSDTHASPSTIRFLLRCLHRQPCSSDPILPFETTFVTRQGLASPEKFSSLLPGQSLAIRWENGAEQQCSLEQLLAMVDPPLGYHEILQSGRRYRWIVCPPACQAPPPGQKYWGINLFLPALRDSQSWGCGDFGSLLRLADQIRSIHSNAPFDFIALNPLHAIANRRPYNTSPYSPTSLFARNFLYLDLESLPEYDSCPNAQRLVESPQFQHTLTSLRSSSEVEYETISRLKLRVLWLLFRQFRKSGSTELDEFRQSCGPYVQSFAEHEALWNYLHRRFPDQWHWFHWQPEWRSPHTPQVRSLLARLQRRIDFFLFLQMRLEQQLSVVQAKLKHWGYRIGLYHDLALSTDRVGADTWAFPQLFAPGARVGSPPDDFNLDGQDWGFPALDPNALLRNGYEFFIQSLRVSAAHGGAVRLDHVMRLARLYWIPDGVSARDGAYVSDHYDAYLGILALESQRRNFIVIGEDLGTVPDQLRHALWQSNVLSYRLILFEREGSQFRAPNTYPQQALCSFTTHDLTTFDGWLSGVDLNLRHSVGHLSHENWQQQLNQRRHDIENLAVSFSIPLPPTSQSDFFPGLLRFLEQTPSCLNLLNWEEFLSESNQQNLPGTTHEYPNWRRPYRISADSLSADSTFQLRLNAYLQLRFPPKDRQ